MKILLTNDDGVYAPGLAALHQALAPCHQVMVVAPETEQSAVGHAITLSDPIRVRRLGPATGYDGWAISGTPADCVKLALHELLPQPPELVVSGINLGANLGVNLLYSGTVSAATEAVLQGVRSLAVSLGTHHDPDFGFSAKFCAHIVDNIDKIRMGTNAPLNINVPAIAEEKIKGVRFTSQSQAKLQERFIRRTDPRGHVYYWQSGETMEKNGQRDTDYLSLLDGYITITPLHHDLTDREALKGLAGSGLTLPK